MSDTTQLVVIGAGPGGYAAAFFAADLGMQVTLVDREPNPGGVCLYRGCIPSKALLHVAKVIGEARHAASLGVTFGEPAIDLDRLRAWKNGVVEKLTGGLGQLGRQRKLTYIQGSASFEDARTLSIETKDGTERLSFEHAIVATGSRPASIPGLPDSPRVLDSTGGARARGRAEALLVIGGGYIGLELGSVYAALGSKVSVVEMMPGLLPGADRDLVNVLAKRMETICEAIMLNTKVVEVKEGKKGLEVRFEGEGVDPKPQTYDKVLVAVGRKPNSAIPGLDKTKVKVNERGFIEVDERRRPPSPRSSPSATSSASRCSRTRRRTRRGWPSRPSRARRWRSSRAPSRPSSSPTPRSPGAG